VGLIRAVTGVLASAVQQLRRKRDQHGEREELRLPVLHRLLEEGPPVALVPEDHRGAAVLLLLRQVLEPPGDGRRDRHVDPPPRLDEQERR
jgi:hypothetical protein